MANTLHILVWMILPLVMGILCNPVKRSTRRQATDSCNGTECVYSDYPIVDVNFPENLTEAIFKELPQIQDNHDTVDDGLQKPEQHIQNLTSTLNVLIGNMANLLQNQLNVLSERLPRRPRHCQDFAGSGSWPYVITPEDGLGSFAVRCDFDTDGGGWTVFQERFDGSVNFRRPWNDYEQGFGSTDGEFWVGLKNLHRLTMIGKWVLRIELEDFHERTAYAVYDSFKVGDAASMYAISLGTYSRGTAGDAISSINNGKFSTLDRDNDNFYNHMARQFGGGWWFHGTYLANPNGPYSGPEGHTNAQFGWATWNGWSPLKKSEMKIRRVK